MDWGVVFKDDVPPNEEIVKIKKYYSDLIYNRSEEFGFDEHLHSCPAMNPVSLGPRIIQLDYDKADLIIQKPEIAFITKYFHPTIPREVGLSNRLLILQALRKLESENRSAFLHLLKELEAYWRIDHSLQGKHFRNFKDIPKTDELVDKAIELSQTAMASPFEELKDLMSA